MQIANTPQTARRRVAVMLLMLALAFATRSLTARFLAAHFADAAWFQYGSYSILDERAQNILDRKESPVWINDASRTDMAVYPPGFPIWMALIYKITGVRGPSSVQHIQVVLDSFSVWLVMGIGVTAFGWRAGVVTGFMSALSPLLATLGAYPMTDAPTSWLVLGGVWMMLLSVKRGSAPWGAGAGLMLGTACWMRVNPVLLIFGWMAALLLFAQTTWRRKTLMVSMMFLAFVLVIAPVIIRNLVFWPEFAPTGLGVGTNLFEGLGETERGRKLGAIYGDALMIEEERRALNLPTDFPLKSYWPDGIRRDRERGRRALAIIKAHPFWYAGTMVKRMAWMFKYWGEPSPIYGTTGINVTARKCLPVKRQGGVLALLVNTIGAAQSIMSHLELPLILVGLFFAWRANWRVTALLLVTILYYALTLSVGHSEIRYGLPMQALLLVFAGLGGYRLVEAIKKKIFFKPV